jgi:hypothetical protein
MQKTTDSTMIDARQRDAAEVEAVADASTTPEPETTGSKKSLRDKVRKNDQYLGTLLG